MATVIQKYKRNVNPLILYEFKRISKLLQTSSVGLIFIKIVVMIYPFE